jgi:hypothetical protein
MTNQTAPTPAADRTALDAHGHNLNDYQWVPVLRKRRADGWSPDKQREFIEALADSGSVAQAAQAVGMSERSAYKLRRSPGAESFDYAWSAATDAAAKRLLDEAFERALVGSDEPVFNRDGDRVGLRFRKSDKMLQFLLRAYMPGRFGGLGQGQGQCQVQGAPGAAYLAASEPVAEALARLLPEPLAEPHTLMEPEALEDALTVANLSDGKLPHWLRDPAPDSLLNAQSPMGEVFERQLEDAKRGGRGEPPMTDEEWRAFLAP